MTQIEQKAEIGPFFATMKIRATDDTAEAQGLLEAFARQQVQAAMAQVAPRVEAAIEQAALDAAVAERARIIKWIREDDDGNGLSAREYAAVLEQGLPVEARV